MAGLASAAEVVLQEGEEVEADTPREISEDRHAALARWWLENNRPFSVWFLTTLPDDDARRKVLVEAAPSMPRRPATARDKTQEDNMTATDWLLPELSQDGLLAGGGKLLVLFFTRRCMKADDETSCCMLQDLKLLNDLNLSGLLPQLDQGALDETVKQGIAFVDPLGDPSESIQLMPHSASIDVKQAVVDRLSNGTLIEARVFLALRMRRDTLLSFLCNLVEVFESSVAVPGQGAPPPLPSPSPSPSSSSNPPSQQQQRQQQQQQQQQPSPSNSKSQAKSSKPAAGGVTDAESQARSALAAAREELKKSVAAVEKALAGGVRFATALEEQRAERRRVKAELKRGLLAGGVVP